MDASKYSAIRVELLGEVEFLDPKDSVLAVLDHETDEIVFFDELLRTRDSSLYDALMGLRAHNRIMGSAVS